MSIFIPRINLRN